MKLNLNHQFQAVAQVAVTKCALFLIFFFCYQSALAQLTIAAATTPQTCSGNGTITITPSGQTAGTVITYMVYLGNDASGTLVHNNTANTVGGQPSGNYYIVATERIGSTTIATATTTAVIDNQTAPISFTLSKTFENCNNGTITVNITAGSPAFYRITPIAGGPSTEQTNNVFTGLAAGQYTIYVEDPCGDGDSEVITVVHQHHQLEIGPALFPEGELPACGELTIANTITSTNGSPIIYPLEATFTVYPPGGGAPVIYNVTIPGGEEFSAMTEQVVDYYYNTPNHKYTLTITDICGNAITTPMLNIDVMPSLYVEMKNGECMGKYLEVRPFKYVGPFTVQFIQSPPGFTPTDYNPTYPGPFTAADMPEGALYFGEDENTLPLGFYQLQVFDACNRPIAVISNTVEVAEPDWQVNAMPTAAYCGGFGKVVIDATGQELEQVIIVSYDGPGEYPTPADVSNYLPTEEGEPGIEIPALPPGDYQVLVIDVCGNVYDDPITEFTIAETSENTAMLSARPDCEPGLGTISVTGGFEIIEIIAAPAGYPHALPHDISDLYSIDKQGITMDGLPPGQYKFKASNDCDSDIVFNPEQVTVLGLTEGTSTFNFIPHCGSFDLFFNNVSNGVAFMKFGLQAYNEVTGEWYNPANGVVYTEGDPLDTDPTSNDSNALKLNNNAMNSDMAYPSGKYRIIKQYEAFAPADADNKTKLCHKSIYEFDYYSDIVIDGAVSVDCMGNTGDVQIIAHGVPPLNYEIIMQNGAPFSVDNGDNSIFSGLEAGIYTVRVSDECSQRTITFNVADIPSLVSAPDPDDLPETEVCDIADDKKEIFDISSYTPLILGSQNPDNVNITYHFSESEAIAGTNPIPDETAVETGTATIYARVTHEMNSDCIALTHFDLIARPLPAINMKDTWAGCEGNEVTIIADSGFDNYEWKQEGGTLTLTGPDRITVSEAGKYTVTVRDDFGCENSKTVEVIHSPLPKIINVVVEDWTDSSNVITVVMQPTPIPTAYEYSIDGINYQDSPVFIGLKPGQYTIHVKDTYECGNDSWPAYILMYPKFFTPNGDNVNDYWKIKFSALEPDMLVYVYDRYGKLITGFGSDSKGWDGTLNGSRLPATDYWFVVKRQNGEELRGHFSMIR